MDEDIKKNFKSKSVWKRGLFMLLFALLYGIAEIVLVAVAVFQFGHALFTGRPNANATTFGYSVGRYIFDITKFVTFNSDERPFPFAPWPPNPAPRADHPATD
ncbi:DUF4389 domain-containing protein [Pseudomonadota bacterium]